MFCNEGRSKKDIADDNQFNYPSKYRLHSRALLQQRHKRTPSHVKMEFFYVRGLGGVAHEQVAPMAQTMRRK